MLQNKRSYLGYKQSYTEGAYMRYGLWLNKFEEVIIKGESEVTVDDISEFKVWLAARYASKSVEYAMTILRNYFVFLRLKDIPCLNPDLIKAPKGRAVSHAAASVEDYKKILAFIEKTMPKNEPRYFQTQLMIRIMGETGVRVSELTSIRIDDVNLEKCGALIDNKKNKNKRWIYWSFTTNQILLEYLPIRKQMNRNTRALFLGRKIYDKAITTRSVERMVRMCCEGAGIKNIVPHSFRHGTAHNILERGGTVADVQKTLGHQSALSSMKYLQYSDKEHERRAKKFLTPEPLTADKAPVYAYA